MALHGATGGASWKRPTPVPNAPPHDAGWTWPWPVDDAASDPCSWEGVGCHQPHNSSVATLNLAGAGLRGTIPASLADLAFLKFLYLQNNNLAGPFPPALVSQNPPGSGTPALGGIQSVNLASNAFEGTIPAALTRMSSLSSIVLSDNRFHGPIPEDIGSLQALEGLLLDGNRLSGTVPRSIGKLQRLSKLRLDHNGLSGAMPDELFDQPYVREFWLNNNAFTSTLPQSLGNATSLTMLHVEANDLTGGLPDSVGNLNTETLHLHLDDNPRLRPDLLDNIARVMATRSQGGALSVLSVANCGLHGSVPRSFALLSNLIMLFAPRNNLTSAAHLLPLSRLARLDLSDNPHLGLGFQWSQLPPSLYQASLSGCGLGSVTGAAFDGFCEATVSSYQMHILDLRDNPLQDQLPPCITANMPQLTQLLLSNTNLVGSLPPMMWTLDELDIEWNPRVNSTLSDILLALCNNCDDADARARAAAAVPTWRRLDSVVGGAAPSCEGGVCLSTLRLSGLKLSGTIPVHLLELFPQLVLLNASHNALEGPLSNRTFVRRSVLDLSFNPLNSEFPPLSTASTESLTL